MSIVKTLRRSQMELSRYRPMQLITEPLLCTNASLTSSWMVFPEDSALRMELGDTTRQSALKSLAQFLMLTSTS